MNRHSQFVLPKSANLFTCGMCRMGYSEDQAFRDSIRPAFFYCAMSGEPKPFVVTRNRHIAPKERRIERLSSGYSVREFRNDSQGRYWYVVVALDVMHVMPTKKCSS